MKMKFMTGLLRTLCLLAMTLAINITYAEDKNIINNINNSNPQLWNLHDVDIMNVIGEVSKVTGKNFLIDPRVQGRVSIVSNHPMKADEVYTVFQSILEVIGYTTIPSGEVTKIVPASGASQMATPLVDAKTKSKNGMVVRVFELKNVGADYVVSALRSYINPQGNLSTIPQSKILIAADYQDNIDRLAEIIKRIDLPIQDQVEAIKLREATASEMASILAKLMEGQRSGIGIQQQIQLASDDRTNTILITGSKDKILQARTLIAKLDVKSDIIDDNTEIKYLKYAKATSLLPLLANIRQEYDQKHTKTDGKGQSGQASLLPTTTYSSQSSNQEQPSSPGFNNGSGSGSNGSSGGEDFIQRDDEKSIIQVAAPGVAADPSLNALILSGPPDLLHMYRNLIRKLDIRKQQILTEIIIAEVTDETVANLGIEWKARIGDGVFGFINDSSTNVGTQSNSVQSISGLTAGYSNGSTLSAVANALMKDSANNVIATPNLLTLDNEWGVAKVGSSIPIETQTTIGSATTTTSTYQYKDVATYVAIQPQISQNDNIILNIREASQGFANNAQITAIKADEPPPVLTTKHFDTRVLLKNKSILVLAGLRENKTSKSNTKIPLLGDLPVLGSLFRVENKSHSKTNLMLFVKPTVIDTADEGINITASKYNLLRDQQIVMANKLSNGITTPSKDEYLAPFSENENTNNIELPCPF